MVPSVRATRLATYHRKFGLRSETYGSCDSAIPHTCSRKPHHIERCLTEQMRGVAQRARTSSIWIGTTRFEEAVMTSTAVSTPGAIRPATDEFLPYYGRYIQRVPEGDVVTTLNSQIRETLALLRGLPESLATYRYAPDKWSVNEMVGHVIDTEKIFAYRALRFARGDRTPIPGYEQDDYVRGSSANSYPLSELADELETVRKA